MSGWVSSGASPRPCSGWAGPPAAGRSGSQGCPVAGSSWHHVRSCQGGLLQGQHGKPQLGDQKGGPGLVGRGASRRMGWGRGEMVGGSNPIFTAGTELRAASLKEAGGRAGKREARGHSSVSPSGWQAGRLDADTGPGIRNGLSPDPEEGRWGGERAHVAPPPAMPVADVTNEA